MVIKFILLALFVSYGCVSVYNFLDTYNNYKFSIDDQECNSIFYCNYVNCILGSILSLFIITYLIFKYLCKDIMDCNVSFSFLKVIVLLSFIGINLWNIVNLSKNKQYCYYKYGLYNYTIAFISIIAFISLTLIINCFKSNKKNRIENYQ